MGKCAGCDQGLPISTETDLAHVRFTWPLELPAKERGLGAVSYPWKYKDLIPCANKIEAAR